MVTVFGLGFVGLTTALGFSQMGHKVYGIDINYDHKEIIRSGKVPFMEPNLEDVLKQTLNKNFFVSDNLKIAMKKSEYIFFCVGTPYGKNGEADLTYLYNALEEAILSIDDDKFRTFIIKSTVPPSTTLTEIKPFIEKKNLNNNCKIGVANNPEFLREGHCWEDFIKADRIVIGVDDKKVEKKLYNLYKTANIPLYFVSLNTSEFIKYLSNSFLATMISFSNEMSMIADYIGDIDISKAFNIFHKDKRWDGCEIVSYMYPGCGYGGYCLPKDTNALYSISKKNEFDANILYNVIKINDEMPKYIVDKIEKSLTNNKTKIGVLGLSFKPNSNDVRDTSSAKIIDILIKRGYKDILVYDPVANEEFHKHYKFNINYAKSTKDLLGYVDVIVIVTAWEEFKNINLYTKKPIVDCRYILNK
ncbi:MULTISPECIES: UDP-glucose/GDP-mannose dehydrogenase family protein [unclassified Clostridioides]|uniref:UDP-glucose dehydrogenase family protein n=1 Tax=unclassified Clostridioides TaxID=2635829 RepID=UPI001D0F8131|nr:nucleotide sugar dehydrogenase [Clostridioides sp. ES-S-0171-01]MCC0688044.1 nucleotide sugar dehydrogenase [Clostridioides sp. ES-S-0056-01]MCC0715259.1 nucleotide sugar dehydrogenase [Clostridioides sp. ES-S-0077-01]UDN54959.1 nucleotide sugar dehydrogenase [Clostridioides sp. ES-S-0054-01]